MLIILSINWKQLFILFDIIMRKPNISRVLFDDSNRGAFGVVKLCEDKVTGKKYACKIVKKKIGSTSSYDQLQREINIMKSVHHQNILQLREVFESPKKVCLVME